MLQTDKIRNSLVHWLAIDSDKRRFLEKIQQAFWKIDPTPGLQIDFNVRYYNKDGIKHVGTLYLIIRVNSAVKNSS